VPDSVDWRTIIALEAANPQPRNGIMRSRKALMTIFFAGVPALLSEVLVAQMPGAPVLQNAFANPGITAALNAASIGGASSYAAAAAWAPGTGRFQLSGGIGLQTRTGASKHTLYGARVNVPLVGATANLGLSVFAGYGALTGGTVDSAVTRSLIPVGATVSYRLGLGTGHGFSLYGSPVYEQVGRGGGASGVSVFRGALGLDVGITSAIGATVGVEVGQRQAAGSGKPSGTAFGFAISYAIRAGR